MFGDLQGCYREFQALLEAINYNPDTDRLGFVGDLVNRGPESLAVLRFIKQLKNPLIVLGNHDLYLLAHGYQCVSANYPHTFSEVLSAPDKMELLDWLRYQSLILNEDFGVLVHAGIPAQWSIAEACLFASDVENELRGPHFKALLSSVETRVIEKQEKISRWDKEAILDERCWYTIQALTQMRFCSATGELDLHSKKLHSIDDEKFKPWFSWRHDDKDLYFGHWAWLEGRCDHPGIYALDAGCAWNGQLKCLRVEDKQVTQLASQR